MEQGFIIDGWRVVPVLNHIERGAEQRHLKPRSMEVLVKLASAGGDVVTRQDLMQAVWGRSVVTEDVLTQSIVEIRKAFEDDARHPRVLETIRKVGFRVIADVQSLEPRTDESGAATIGHTRRIRRQWVVVSVAAMLTIVVLWLTDGQHRSTDSAFEGARSVAVMPFVNLSDDASNEYFSHGLSEEILNALATVPGLRVPARTSSFAVADQNLDAREIGERLDVTKILEGSVRKSGDRIRVTAQLIDARTGFHVWSRTWDRRFDDVFIVQDEISAAITDMLLDGQGAGNLQAASRPRTNSMEAYDFYLLGRHYQALGQFAGARERFERAVRADPNYARAYAGLAESYLSFREVPSSYWQSEAADYHSGLELADEAIETALQLDPSLVDALLAQAQLKRARLDCEASGSILERALSIEPTSAGALHQMARHLTIEMKFDAALEHFLAAHERDPLNPQLVSDFSRLHARMGQYEEANAVVLRLIDSGVESPALYETLMQNAEDFGRYDERIRWGRELVRLAPTRASALAELGDAYAMLGMLDAAEHWIRRADAISEAQAFKARQRWLWIQGRDKDFLELANRKLLGAEGMTETVLSPAQSATFGIGAIAKLQGERPEVAALLADRVIRQSPTLPYRGVHIVLYSQGVLAMAQRASGDHDAADLTIERAIELGRRAQDETVSDYPPLLRQLAVHYALRGQLNIALDYLSRAIDSGWRAEYLEGRKPGNDPNWSAFTRHPAYIELKAKVEVDLQAMREEVKNSYASHYWENEGEPLSSL